MAAACRDPTPAVLRPPVTPPMAEITNGMGRGDDIWVPHVIDGLNEFESHDLGSIVGVRSKKLKI